MLMTAWNMNMRRSQTKLIPVARMKFSAQKREVRQLTCGCDSSVWFCHHFCPFRASRVVILCCSPVPVLDIFRLVRFSAFLFLCSSALKPSNIHHSE